MADLMQGYNAVMQGGMQGYNIAKLIGKEFDDYYDRKAFEEADKELDAAIAEADTKSALARAAAMTKPGTDPANSLGKTADVPSPNAIEAFGGYKPTGTETSHTPAPQPTSSVIGGSNALGSAADVDGSRTVSPTYKPGLVDNPEGYTTGEQKQEAPAQSSVVKDNATSGMVTDRKAFDMAESERAYTVGKAQMEADIKKMGIAYNRMMQNGEYGKAMEMKDKIDNKRASVIAQEVSYKLDSGDPDTMEKALKMVNSHLDGANYSVKDGVVTFTDKDGKVHENYEPPAAVMQAAKALVISDAVLKHFSDNQTQAANKKDAVNALQQFSKDERQKKLDALDESVKKSEIAKNYATVNNINADTTSKGVQDEYTMAKTDATRTQSWLAGLGAQGILSDNQLKQAKVETEKTIAALNKIKVGKSEDERRLIDAQIAHLSAQSYLLVAQANGQTNKDELAKAQAEEAKAKAGYFSELGQAKAAAATGGKSNEFTSSVLTHEDGSTEVIVFSKATGRPAGRFVSKQVNGVTLESEFLPIVNRVDAMGQFGAGGNSAAPAAASGVQSPTMPELSTDIDEATAQLTAARAKNIQPYGGYMFYVVNGEQVAQKLGTSKVFPAKEAIKLIKNK